MAITSTCAGCGRTLAVAEEFAGRLARCPQCGQVYTVPQPPAGAAPNPFSDSPSSPTGSSPNTGTDRIAPRGSLAPNWNTGESAASSGSPLPPTLTPLSNNAPSSTEQYWMKATDGREYGPVDHASLQRWFNEGRVGPGYMIRSGEFGVWQPATMFQQYSSASNPFVASVQPATTGYANVQSNAGSYPAQFGPQTVGNNPYAAVGNATVSGKQFIKSDQSALVLTMGILSWIFFCPVFGIIAWVIGYQALRDIRDGLSNPTNVNLVQVGYYLGMIQTLFCICCFGFGLIVNVISAIAGNL